MRAVQFKQHGGPEVLEVVQVAEPHAGAGEVRIAVRAAGVNGIDGKLRGGAMSAIRPIPLPSGTGIDAAGVVDEVGDGVDGVAIGDAVFGTGTATYAERAVLSHWAAMPTGLSFEEAAGFPIAAETAQRILQLSGVRPGQTLLVSGASGGVGSAAVQFARHRGITVIGTASPEHQQYLRSLGAIPTTYGDGLSERVRALAPHGVDAALDIAGSGIIPQLVALTGDAGRVVSIADFTATQYGAQTSFTGENHAAAFADAARLFTEGAFRMPVAQRFTLDEAAPAQQASAAGHVAGKFVVVVV